MYRKKVFLTLILWLFKSFLFGQPANVKFQHFKVEEGIAEGKISNLLIDFKGYLWIGTVDGLNKYDGNRLTVYKHDRACKFTLKSNSVNALFEDKNKTLWVCTTFGLSYYDRKKDIFIPVELNTTLKTLTNSNITNGLEDKSGNIWLTTAGNGLIKYDKNKSSTGNYTYSSDKNSISSNYLWTICEDSNGKIWLGSDSGLINFTQKMNNQPAFHRINLKNAGIQTVWSLKPDKHGKIWVGCLGFGLIKIDQVNEQYQIFNEKNANLSDKNPYSFLLDNDGRIWVGTYNGLNVFHSSNNKFFNFYNYPNKSNSLSDNCIWAMVQDNSGIIWIGTNKGLNKYDKRIEQFRHFENNPDDGQTLRDNYIYTLCQDSDSCFWIGTKSGLDKFNLKTGTFEHLFSGIVQDASLKNISIRGLERDKSGNLWICSWGNGLYKYHIKSGKLTNYMNIKDNQNSIPSNFIRHIYIDKSDEIWIGSLIGLTNFNQKTGQFKTFISIQNDSTTLSGRNVFEIYEDSHNNLWVGTLFNGLNKFDRKTGKCVRYVNKDSDIHSISNNSIICVHESKNGTLWIATRNGLNKFNYQTEEFETFTIKNGLPNDAILGIIEDHHGVLWISTNFGLSRFNPEKSEFKNYFQKDGMQSNEFVSGSFLKMPSGDLVFGGINGINIFNPDSLKDNSFIPEVVISDFKIFNQSVKIDETINNDVIIENSISETEQIDLSYKNNVFSIDFSALDFTAPEYNLYAYKLENFDNDWISTSAARRYVTYTNLDGGTYTFKVKCSNSNGKWNGNYKSLKIIIHPPFWETIWFRIILIILFLGIFLLLFTLRIRRMKEQKEVLEGLVKQRTAEILIQKEEILTQNEQLQLLNTTKDKFFSIIAHDLRNPFGSIFGLAHLVIQEKENSDISKYKKYFQLIYDAAKNGYNLLENLLQWSLSQTGKINYSPNKLNLKFIVAQSIATIENTAFLKNIHMINNVDDSYNVFADVDLTNTVLRNVISNAIKFTRKNGEIILDAIIEDKLIKISVKDNGVGIGQERLDKIFTLAAKSNTHGTDFEKGTGLGLNLCQEFIKKQGGKIWVESEEGIGSTFYFTLPLFDDEKPV